VFCISKLRTTFTLRDSFSREKTAYRSWRLLFGHCGICNDFLQLLRRLHAGLPPHGLPFFVHLLAIAGFLSTSICTILAESPISRATSVSIGFIALHGPHHVAIKSTSTGLSPLISSLNDSFFSIFSEVFNNFQNAPSQQQ